MATRRIKSVKGRVMRLTRLDECGNPYVGDCATIVSDGFISVGISDEVEAGEEYTQKNAWGDFCIAEKDPDRRKWINVTISMCEVDPDVLDLIGGADPITNDAGDKIGVGFGRDPNPNAFAIEVWTKKAGGDACAGGAGMPEWGYFCIPNVTNGSLDGDITIENGPLTIGLKGEGQPASESWTTTGGPYPDAPLGEGLPPDDLSFIGVTDVQPPEVTDGCEPLAAAVTPTGATAGTPGAFTPAGAAPPADLAALQALGSLGQTATWTTGQYVVLGDATQASWNGTAWIAGPAA